MGNLDFEQKEEILRQVGKYLLKKIKELHKQGYSSNEIYGIMYKDKEIKKGISFIKQVINIFDL